MNATLIERCLLVAAPLKCIQDHVTERWPDAGVDDLGAELTRLATRWRDARSAFAELSKSEADCADQCAILPVPSSMAEHAAALIAAPHVTRWHEAVPVSLGLVEADALVASRISVYDERVAELTRSYLAAPSDAALAQCCWPLQEDGEANLQLRRTADGFSLSEDGAAFEVAPVLHGHPCTGSAVMSLNLLQSPRVMHAVRFADRVVMVRGHHRALALRAAGVAYLPCLISVCSSLDDLHACAPELLLERERLFDAKRPPMLRDFDRSKLTHTFRAQRMKRQLRVTVQVQRDWVVA